ncbi:hypothetical protein KQH60_05795 [Mycetohabitans sp. B8]|uniref:hypothetical protein n=1 Tax=Mycetohabitans sp. B8 TaxID=2841845 RepID=UPI001F2EF658|nr:hypothetical protein [Mycetohabitans sp. B8]MCG1042093.1 hypothetical protein [Mycetohabitans sp. B8]
MRSYQRMRQRRRAYRHRPHGPGSTQPAPAAVHPIDRERIASVYGLTPHCSTPTPACHARPIHDNATSTIDVSSWTTTHSTHVVNATRVALALRFVG